MDRVTKRPLFYPLLGAPKFTDAILKTTCGAEYPVHKAIPNESRPILVEMNRYLLELFLIFIYTGDIIETWPANRRPTTPTPGLAKEPTSSADKLLEASTSPSPKVENSPTTNTEEPLEDSIADEVTIPVFSANATAQSSTTFAFPSGSSAPGVGGFLYGKSSANTGPTIPFETFNFTYTSSTSGSKGEITGQKYQFEVPKLPKSPEYENPQKDLQVLVQLYRIGEYYQVVQLQELTYHYIRLQLEIGTHHTQFVETLQCLYTEPVGSDTQLIGLFETVLANDAWGDITTQPVYLVLKQHNLLAANMTAMMAQRLKMKNLLNKCHCEKTILGKEKADIKMRCSNHLNDIQYRHSHACKIIDKLPCNCEIPYTTKAQDQEMIKLPLPTFVVPSDFKQR